MRYALAIVPLLMATSCAAVPTAAEQEAAFLALTEAHFRDTITIEDDPLDPNITIDTHLGYQQTALFAPKQDQFLRGLAFRENGLLILQAYVTSDTRGSWLFPTQASFAHTLSLRPVTTVHSDVDCGYTPCRHYEHVVFEFTPEELDAVIAEIEVRGEQTLAYRILGQSGLDRDGLFHVNELKAFREATMPYRSENPNPE